jgi:hypothetical protein
MRVAVAVLAVVTLCGCRKTVSCRVDSFGQCHEWRDASLATRREIEQAVCKKNDERFVMEACPRERSYGECAFGSDQTTVWYDGGAIGRATAEQLCRDNAGAWTSH